MTIDDQLLQRLSKLSALKIDDDKKASLEKELSDIVDFVENLNEVDVSSISATFTTIEGGTTLRDDQAVQDLDLSNQIVQNAPKSEDGSFVVPKILE
jgi:aspartyl-tRNA(Asn)/glutamyl-tRNA(Gln) amidotransferase subunit C